MEAAGASGRVEKARAAALCGRRDRDRPAPTQAFRPAARPLGGPRPMDNPARRPLHQDDPACGSRLGGRSAPSRQSDRRFAAGPSGSPTAKREVTQRGGVGVEAQDFGAGRGARAARAAERKAPAARGSVRKNASSKASPAPAANSGSPSPALPLVRAQAGIGRRWWQGLGAPGFSLRVALQLAAALRRETAPRRASPGSAGGFRRERSRSAQIHRGMMSLARRFVTLCGDDCALLVVRWRCPIRLHYRTRFESALGRHGKSRKIRP